MPFEVFTLAKPEEYEKLDEKSLEGVIKADHQILPTLKLLIDTGSDQIRAMTGYDNSNIPDESPKTKEPFKLDDIELKLRTTVQTINPAYQQAFDKITGFLEVLVNDWNHGIRRDNVRTYTVKLGDRTEVKGPWVEWNYLMWNVLWYQSRVTGLNVKNEIKKVIPPQELADMKLMQLAIPVELLKDFQIDKPGAAKIWYLSARFYKEIQEDTVKPAKKAAVKKSGITEMPSETNEYLEQFQNLVYKLQSIPSPRRQAGQVLQNVFKIPQKDKPKGSKEVPVIVTPDNYQELLESYRSILSTSLQTWKKLEENIGELVTFYYGIQNHPRIQKEYTYLPNYALQQDGDRMDISIQALYYRLKGLEKELITDRLLHKHEILPLVL